MTHAKIQNMFEQISREFQFTNFDIETFKKYIERRMDCNITLMPYPFNETTLTGLWVTTPTMEYIAYNSTSHVLLQEHIILHEFAHLLLGHIPQRDGQQIFLMRDIDDMTSGDEQEAEWLAGLIMKAVVKKRRKNDWRSDYE